MDKYELDDVKFNKLKELVYSLLEIDSDFPTDSVSQENLDTWNSSQHLSLVMELESAFGVSFRIQEVTDMRAFEDIVYYLGQKKVFENVG